MGTTTVETMCFCEPVNYRYLKPDLCYFIASDGLSIVRYSSSIFLSFHSLCAIILIIFCSISLPTFQACVFVIEGHTFCWVYNTSGVGLLCCSDVTSQFWTRNVASRVCFQFHLHRYVGLFPLNTWLYLTLFWMSGWLFLTVRLLFI